MADFQAEKQIVRDLHQALENARPADIAQVLSDRVTADWVWRGFEPFGIVEGAAAVANRFWEPLHRAFGCLQIREDVFFAGANEMDGEATIWVASMGHLMGLLDGEWLGIPPTGRLAMLRYCEFNRVAGGRIAETAMYFDVPHLMVQTGLRPFPDQSAAQLVQPGPRTHDGLLYDPQDAEEGKRTLAAINAMIRDLGQWQSGLPLHDELARSWDERMLWWGPTGIGATYTIPRYAEQHAAPFRRIFGKRSKTRHICRIAEGSYGGFFGWPNFVATPEGKFMGLPTSGAEAEFRVIDIYRRAGDQLAENWIFIDMLHFWKSQGIDILARATGDTGA